MIAWIQLKSRGSEPDIYRDLREEPEQVSEQKLSDDELYLG